MADLYICDCVAEEGDGNFGTITVQQRGGCDSEIFGLHCSNPPYDPCVLEGAICPDGGGTCVSYSIPVGGANHYDSLDSFTQRQPFKKSGSGTVTVDILVDVIGCTSVIEGTGSEPAVSGDYIKATVFFSIGTGGDGCPSLQPVAVPTLTAMTTLDGLTFIGQDGAIGGLSCAFSFSTTFDDAGWLGASALGQMELRVQLRGYHSDDSPAAFCIKASSGTYMVQIAATINGDCCAPTISIADVD